MRVHYAAEIVAGTLHKGLLRRDDRSLYWKIFHDKLWGELGIVTKPQWNSQRLDALERGELNVSLEEGIRLQRQGDADFAS